MFDLRLSGDWAEGRVVARWTHSTFAPTPEVAELIERTWAEQSARPGVHLFDGPMCRLEGAGAGHDGALELALSRTGYKAFVGTNYHNAAAIVARHGRAALANPVGLSCGLLSADGFLILGRRNARVAYYPERVHPFAGALEPPAEAGDAPDVFAEVRRELAEELGLAAADVVELRCLGIVEDRSLMQPEMVFVARARLACAEVEARLDAAEHRACVAIEATADGFERALRDAAQFTPVGVGTVRLVAGWLDGAARGGC